MVRAGRLSERVIIQTSTEARDSLGQAIPTWTTFATRWASIEPLRGDELFKAQTINAELTHQVRIRYIAGVTPKMRVLYGTRILRILQVADVFEEHRELVLLCAEWVTT
jgi:SPP1 family predicted phage head-tail adaptor